MTTAEDVELEEEDRSRKPSKAVVCGSGVVSVTFKKAGTTISSRIFQLKSDCSFSSKVTFRSRLRTRIGELTVQTRFQGNSYMRPANAAEDTVTAGKGT